MSSSAILGMVIIIGFVFGGFIYFLSIAIHKEIVRKKKAGKNKDLIP